MPLYRCLNPACTTHDYGISKFDFWSEQPMCPKCGASAKDPESCHLILPLASIHFHIINKWGRGTGMRACDGKPFGRQPAAITPQLVTCPECKLTEAWRQAAQVSGFEPVVEISPERGEELRTAAAATIKAMGGTEKAKS